MGGDNAIGGLSTSIELDRFAMASENPTIEVLVKVMGGELSMIGMGDVAAEDTGHTGIVLQWSDEIHQPHTIRRNGVLSDERDVLPSGEFDPKIAGSAMAEILFANLVQAQSFVLRQMIKTSIA